MQVYKTFLKISLRNIGQVSIYVVLFFVLLIMSANMNASNATASFAPDKVRIGVVDADNSRLSRSLYTYLEKNHTIVEISSDEEKWRDSLFYHETEYILVIPQGFEEGFQEGTEGSADGLTAYRLPDSNSAYIVASQIESYLDNLKVLLDTQAYDYDKAMEKAQEISGRSSAVEFSNETGNSHTNSKLQAFYMVLPYILLCILINSAGPMLIIWNRTEIKMRNTISAMPLGARTKGIIGAVGTYALAVFAIVIVLSIVMCKEAFLSPVGLYYVLNTFTYLLVCVAVAYTVAQFTKKMNMLSVWSNVIGLSTSFLCGVFVGRDLLPEGVGNFSKVLPTYWYINVTEELRSFDGSLSSSGWYSMGIQLLYALALFVVGMVIVKYKREKV